jgi:hypothetical protein
MLNGYRPGKCPRCGASAFRRVKPDRLVAFADDRVCGACAARYTPPSPVWAGIAFMMCGLALPVLGLVLSSILFGDDLFSLPGLGCTGAFLVLSVVVFVGGVRELFRFEKQAPAGRPSLEEKAQDR